MKNSFVLLYVIICLVSSCTNGNDSKLEIREYYAEGVIDSNRLEKGAWKFYDSEKHDLCQEGQFVNGVRTGMWNYYSPFKSSLFWSPYYSTDSLFKTNIPDFFAIDTEDSNFIAFKHKDTSKLILLKIGVGFYANFNNDTYNKAMLQEVTENSLQVNDRAFTEIKTTCSKKYNFNKFSGIDKEHRNYTLLTINNISNNFLAEIVVRFDTTYRNIGEETFFSVMSNLFIGGNRFFDGNIDCEIIHNKVIKDKRTFSFGCNRR
jgi:hypothetical protein